jgi:hypothetical protein
MELITSEPPAMARTDTPAASVVYTAYGSVTYPTREGDAGKGVTASPDGKVMQADVATPPSPAQDRYHCLRRSVAC